MKLLTHSRLIVLAMVLAVCGVGVWVDRRQASISEGQVAIDKTFLQRLETEDPATTRDPAIKALSSATFRGGLLRDMLISGAVQANIRRLDRDSVVVTVREAYGLDIIATTEIGYTRNRLRWREFLTPGSWRESFLHREYWALRSSSSVSRLTLRQERF